MPFWISLFVVIIMCCVMSLVNSGGIPFHGILRDILIGAVVAYLAACVSSLPLGLGVGYIAGLLVTPLAMKLTAMMCAKD